MNVGLIEMKKKYEYEDLLKVSNHEMSSKECAEKYGTESKNIYKAMFRQRMFVYKKRIRIKTPYGNKVVRGITACAEELKLSPTSVKRALRGERVVCLEELNITLEYAEESK